MRIAFITYEYPPDTGKGGIGTYTSQVASMLTDIGWDVHVFAGSHTRNTMFKENNIHVHWVKCGNPQDFALNVLPVFEAAHFIRAFEVIESPEIHGNAWEIKKAFPQIPLVVRLHAPNWLVEHLKKRYVPISAKLRFMLGALRRGRWDTGYWRRYDYKSDPDFQFTLQANFVSAPSQTMKKWVNDNWKHPAIAVTLLPNPFRAPDALKELVIHRNSIHKEIVFFGRLNVLKGLVNATLAMKKILQEFPDYSFKVIGDDGPGPHSAGTVRKWMKAQLKEVIDRVIFFDGVAYEKLPALIEDAEIALLPSLFESFSYTCAEAMAAGKAVVGSRDTGMTDLVQHNITGLLVDAQMVQDIYVAIKKLIQNDELRYSMAVNARKSILEKFNEAIIVQQYVDFYTMAAITV